MRIFTLPPTAETPPEPNFYDSMKKIRLRQQLEMYSIGKSEGGGGSPALPGAVPKAVASSLVQWERPRSWGTVWAGALQQPGPQDCCVRKYGARERHYPKANVRTESRIPCYTLKERGRSGCFQNVDGFVKVERTVES